MAETTEHNDPDSAYRRFERAIEWPMLVLSIIFVGLLIVPEVTGIDRTSVEVAMGLIWAAFAMEVLTLAYLAPSKRRMLREHWLDVLIVAAPFLRPLRIARVLRVVRGGSAVGRTLVGISAVVQRRGLQVYGLFTVLVIIGGALLVYGLERDTDGSNITTVGDALWWAVVTTTTVGYGDHFPTSPDARAVAAVLMLVGIGLVGVVTANIAAFFVEEEQRSEIAELRSQLDRIEAILTGDDGGSDGSLRRP